MKRDAFDNGDWLENEAEQQVSAERFFTMLGLPASWGTHGWLIGAATYSAFWLLQGWMFGWPSPGLAGLAHSAWSLLLTLALCYTMLQLCRPHFRSLGHALCLVIAATMPFIMAL